MSPREGSDTNLTKLAVELELSKPDIPVLSERFAENIFNILSGTL
jgi:hypothetical protein